MIASKSLFYISLCSIALVFLHWSCDSPKSEVINSNIPDTAFRVYLKEQIPDAFDGDNLNVESSAVKELKTISIITDTNLTSLEGLEYFTGLETLKLIGIPELVSLDVSNLENLKTLECINTAVEAIIFNNNPSLQQIDCSINGNLTYLNLSKLNALQSLDCSKSKLSLIQFGEHPNFTNLDCSDNQLESIDLSEISSLTNLNCMTNILHRLDIRESQSISRIDIDVSNDRENPLETLRIHYNIRQLSVFKNSKQIRGSNLVIKTYNNNNIIVCDNYNPNTDECNDSK